MDRLGLLNSASLAVGVLLFMRASPLHAQFSHKIDYRPHALVFGQEVILGANGAQSNPKQIVLVNQGSAPLSVGQPTVNGDFNIYKTSTTCGSILAPQSRCEVAVVFQPIAPGKRTGTLMISNSSSNAPRILVPLSGVGVTGHLTYHPKAIGFPPTLVGSTSSKVASVLLFNNNPVTMTISGISASLPFGQTNNCGTSLAARSGCTAQVTFSPSRLGVQRGALIISDDAAGGSQKVALHGTGSATPSARSSVGYVVMGSVSNSSNQSALFAIPWLKSSSFSDRWIIFPYTDDSMDSVMAVGPVQTNGFACVLAGGYDTGNLYSYRFNPVAGTATAVSTVAAYPPDSFPNGTIRPNADYIYLLENPSGTIWNLDVYLVASDCSFSLVKKIMAPDAAISASTDSNGQYLFVVGDCPGNGGNSCIYSYSLSNPASPSATGAPLQLPSPGCRPSTGIVGVPSGLIPVPSTEVLAAEGNACTGSGPAVNEHILSYLYTGVLTLGSAIDVSPWLPLGLTAEPSGQWVYYSANRQTATSTQYSLIQFDVNSSSGKLTESSSGPLLVPSSVAGSDGDLTFGKDTLGREWIFETAGSGAAAWALDPATGRLTFKTISPAPRNFTGGLVPETLGFIP